MSASPQALHSAGERVKGFVKRLIGGLHKGKTRVQVAASDRRSKWTAISLLPDLNRISRGTGQAAVLWSIYRHTEGEPHERSSKKWRPENYTPPMIPDDFAKESGFSSEQMAQDIKDAVARGLISRKSEDDGLFAEDDGHLDWYRFRLCRDEWPKIPNAARPVQRKPVKSEGAFPEESDTSGESQPSTLGRNVGLKLCAGGSRPTLVKAGESRQIGKLDWGGSKIPISARNETSVPVALRPAVTDEGKSIEVLVETRDLDRPDCAESPAADRPPAARGQPAAGHRNGNGRLVMVYMGQFPEFTRQIQDSYKATEDSFIERLLADCVEAIRLEGLPASLLTDSRLIEAANQCALPNQRSAGFFKTKLPTFLRNHARAWLRSNRR